MTGKGNLTELLKKEPLDLRSLMQFCLSKKLDVNNMVEIAVAFRQMDKSLWSKITPLHLACKACTPDEIRFLAKEGWSIDSDFDEIESPLCIALDYGNIPVARCLIELGADPNKMSKHKITPLCFAFNSGNKTKKTCLSAVKFLLEVGVSVNAVIMGKTGERPLHRAVYLGLQKVTSYLLQKGADVNEVDLNKCTPLHVAVYEERPEMITLLLLHGADKYKCNAGIEDPFFCALKLNKKLAVETLLARGCDVNGILCNGTTTAIQAAVLFMNLDMIKLLLSLGADPNKVSANGVSTIHTLSTLYTFELTQKNYDFKLHKDVVEVLVEHGGNINLSHQGYAPLEIAVNCKLLKLANHFIKLGANVNIKSKDITNGTLFHEIIPLNHDIINNFLDYGADYTAYNLKGETPYHLAIINTIDLGFVKYFIKHGCPYNQNLTNWWKISKKASNDCLTFFKAEQQFFEAMKRNDLQLLKSAVKNGAIPTSCCEEIKYPLHFVACAGYEDLVKFLLENNSPVNCLNSKGESVLHIAAKSGHYNICQILLSCGACYNYTSKQCPKTPSKIARELNHNNISELFHKVDRMFKLVCQKKDRCIRELQKAAQQDKRDFLMFINVINIRGETLFTTALRHGCDTLAGEIILLRTKYTNCI